MTTFSVFVSNARQDDALASAIASFLRQRGCDVWWHEAFSKSAAYRARTQRALADSQVVMVIWSAASRTSAWVLDEADAGIRRGPIVSLEAGDAHRPLGYSGSAPVRVDGAGGALTPGEQEEVWEAVMEGLQAGRTAEQGRRAWLDRSIAAGVANVSASAVLFAGLAALGAFAHWPPAVQGGAWILIAAALFAAAVCCGYAADRVAQGFGAAPRDQRIRLACRWLGEAFGGGLGATLLVLAARLFRQHYPWSRLFDWQLLSVLLVAGCLSALLLSAKFMPLLASRRLRRRLLGRPAGTQAS